MADFDLAMKLRIDQGNAQAGLRQFAGTAKGSFRDVSRSADKAGKSLDDAFNTLGVRSTRQIQADIKRVRQSLQKMGRDGRVSGQELARGQRAAKEQIRALKRELGGTSELMGELRNRSLATVGAITAVGFATSRAAQASAEFSKGMAEVSTLLDDTSGMPALREEVRALTREYGGDVNKNSKALYDIISAGAEDAAEAMGTLEVANRLAIGGVTDVSTAADGLTSILNAYGYEGERAAEVSDALFTAVREGKTTVPELSQSIGQLAPLAATAGVSLDEMLSAVAALTAAGVKTPQAITGVRSAISNVIKPTSQATELAGELGLEFNAAALESKGLAGFMDDVRRATGGSTEQMSLLFGDVEGLNAVLSLTGQGAEDFGDAIEAMGEKAGATDEAVGKMMDTAAQKQARFTAALKDVQISLGDAATSLTPLIEGLTSLIDAFNDLPEPVRTATSTAALLTAAAIPAGMAIRAIYSAGKLLAGISIARSLAGAPAAITATGNAAAGAAPKLRALAAIKKIGIAGVFGFTAVQLYRLIDAMQEAQAVEEELARAQARRQSERQTTMDINAGSAEVERKSREQLDVMTDYEREAYAKRLQQARDYWQARRDMISEQDYAETGELTSSDEALEAARRAREYAEANRELADLDADREDALRDHRDAVASVRADMRNDLKSRLDEEVQSYQDANKLIEDLQKQRLQIEQRYKDELAKFDDSQQSIDGGAEAPDYLDIYGATQNANRAMERGDTDEAVDYANQARELIEAADQAGSVGETWLNTLLSNARRVVEDAQTAELAANEAAQGNAEAELERAKQSAQQIKEDLAWLENISVGFDEDAANASADQLRAQLQKRLDNNPLVIPVTTSDLSGDGEKPPGFATGGMIRGPGTGTSDSMLARLSNGEYVIKAAAVRRFGRGFFDQLNDLRLPKFASGGLVNNLQMPSLKMPASSVGGNSGGETHYWTLPGGQQVGPFRSEPDVTRQLKRAAAMHGGAR